MFLEFLIASCIAEYVDNLEYDMRVREAEQDDIQEYLYNELHYLRQKVERLEAEKYNK